MHLYALASNAPKDNSINLKFVTEKIMKGDLKNDRQITTAVKFLLTHPLYTEAEFNEECGVGCIISQEKIDFAVNSVISENKSILIQDRYSNDLNALFRKVRDLSEMKWADSKALKQTFDLKIKEILGEKTAADEQQKKKDSKKAEREKKAEENPNVRIFEGDVLKLHKPGENKQIRPELMEQHLKATGGKVITRFPPEPNGFLHIGHAKAMNFNFRYAEAHSGECNLRFDDTNPEAEEDRYYKAIKENVDWLGFKPARITYASDNFQKLYEFAVELIKKGKAYICQMTQEEIHNSRGGDEKGPRFDSPFRNRPIEENLALFDKMKRGEFKEGECVLRLKQNMQSDNPFMWDLIAYRVLTHPHCRTGNQWNIYPMYDFTHCLCDSLENITHSLCSTEFILAREAYYWVCDNVEVYKPVQWEFGRLRITNTVLSKRKLTKLVTDGIVAGWDDPRLFTLAAVRRRGFTPKAINTFAEKLGITTATTTVDVRFLESCVRDDLNEVAPRRMAIFDPLLITITNLPEDYLEFIEIPDFPNNPSSAVKSVPFTRQLYIDRSDFREEADANFFRLTPNASVGLYKSKIIICKKIIKNSANQIVALEAECDLTNSIKPKTFIQWIASSPSHSSPMKCEIRLYSDLFKSKMPETVQGGFMNDVAENSLTVIKSAMVDCRLFDAKVEETFQFQRIGYFCLDKDSGIGAGGGVEGRLVFNKTVSLKEDPSKD